MQRAKFYGEIVRIDDECDDTTLKLDRWGVYHSYLNSLEVGQRVEVEIRKESEDITLNQYAYYFSCIVDPMSDSTGYTKKEQDGVLCKQLLTENIGLPNEYVKSKADLNRTELAKFIDTAAMLAAQIGVVVMPPNKFWKNLE